MNYNILLKKEVFIVSYCSNCGARIKDNGVCPNCGSISESSIPSAQKKSSEILVCIKSFFSSRPLLGVENASRTNASAVWIAFGVIYEVASVIFGTKLLFTPKNIPLIELLLGDKAANAAKTACGEISADMLKSMSLLTVYIVLMSAALFLIISCAVKGIYYLADAKPTFSQALNITAVSIFPLSCALVLAAITSSFSLFLSLVLILAGVTTSAISLYYGIQKAAVFSKSPFWYFAGGCLGCGILFELLSAMLISIIF